MRNFADLQEKTKKYIEENYSKALEAIELTNVTYIDDFLNLDKYQHNYQLFYDFGSWSFDSLSNESEKAGLDLRIYLTFKNGKSSVLSDTMYKYAGAFYKVFDDSGTNFGGVFDYGRITDLRFYQAAEGSLNTKVAEISMKLFIET